MFLRVTDLNFGFSSEKNILNGISLNLELGSTLAIVGASGCGKSTLLRILSGILSPSKNKWLHGDVKINELSPNEYRQTGKLSFMFQEATLLPNLTVKENIGLPLKIKELNDTNKVAGLLNAVGLAEYANYLPKQLSGGMKTRVALARSFVNNPELLLLDEPFSALDIAWKSKLYLELEKLREQYNTTVVIVTHDVQEALLLADYVIVLNSLGLIELRKQIKTDFSILQRVSNISAYMNSIYENLMLPIQDAIINGQKIQNEKQDTVHIA